MDDQNGADAPESEAVKPLTEDICDLLMATAPPSLAEGQQREQLIRDQANAVMHLLNERGHYLPGYPCAAQIRDDAQQFAEELILTKLVVRMLRMFSTNLVTPETKGAKRWIDDYIDGKNNHGPLGKAMYWPGGLPGLCQMLREWGFQPSATKPQYVCRKPQNRTIQ